MTTVLDAWLEALIRDGKSEALQSGLCIANDDVGHFGLE
jgi:hypothetical protein